MSRIRKQQGFTLVELMTVVALISVLASIAIPSYLRYIRKTKSAEAIQGVRLLYTSARTYILEETAARGSGSTPAMFPESAAVTPAASCCLGGGKCSVDLAQWNTPAWNALRFSMGDPHFFRYEFVSSGTSAASRFTARARGDLNCNGVESTFEMIGAYDGSEVMGSAGLHILKAEE